MTKINNGGTDKETGMGGVHGYGQLEELHKQAKQKKKKNVPESKMKQICA